MSLISLWYENNIETDIIVNKFNNCNTETYYKLNNEELNDFISPFFLHALFFFVSLSWIIDNNNHLNLHIE